MAVAIGDGCLWVDGQRVPLLAGEVHYWRLDPRHWGRILDRCRELGLGMVATYVCWHDHEVAPGRFDFAGRTSPSRNLVGFMELLHEKGFWVFVRPGPYAYAEWTNAGVPDRVVGLPRISEAYRREARVWMEAVVGVLRPYFAAGGAAGGSGGGSGGGRIVLLQADNEFDLFSHWFEGACGLDGARAGAPGAAAPAGAAGADGGYFQRFVREAYADIAELNEAWGTRYASFDEAAAFAEAPDGADPRARARRRDYWRFQHWAVREGVRWHVEEYRRLGVGVPIIANYYPGGDVQNWRELATAVDLVGIDWYPRQEFGAGAAPGRGPSMTGGGAGAPAEEHRRFLDTCRYQRAISPIPCSPEQECGVWHGYHEHVGVLTPNHYRLMFYAALIAGLKGINWYMLAGRDNWYYTPINERGDLRPELAEVFLDLHRVWREVDPPSLTKLCGAAAAFDVGQVGPDDLFASNPMLRALYEADADFEFFDPERHEGGREGGSGPGSEAAGKRLMFYAGADWLSRGAAARVARWVEEGGTLVLFRQRPVRDERFRPFDALGLIEPDGVLSRLGKKVRVEFPSRRGLAEAGPAGAVAEGAVWRWEARTLAAAGAEPIWATQVAGTQQAIENADAWMNNYRGRRWIAGYVRPRGRGRVVQVGVPANAGLVRAAHGWAGVPLYAQAALAGVHTGLFRRPDGSLALAATNMNGADLSCRVRLDGVDLPPTAAARDVGAGRPAAIVDGQVVIDLARRSGGAWVIGGVSE